MHNRSMFCLCLVFTVLTPLHVLSQSGGDFDPGTPGATCSPNGCITTYHNDNARTGVYPYETQLIPSVVSSNTAFGLKTTFSGFDSLIYAQPLFVSGVIAGKIANCPNATQVVIVATLNNTIYAVDVTTGSSTLWSICWHTSLSNLTTDFPIPFTATNYSSTNSNPCNNLVPQGGITGTPVIDTKVNPPAIYAISGHKFTSGSTPYDYQLNILRLDTGALKSTVPITAQMTGTGFNAQYENQRAGLAMYKPSAGGFVNLYVGFSSHCDYQPSAGSSQGYVAGFKFTYRGSVVSFLGSYTTEASSNNLGGIWSVGAAPPVDPGGNIYLSSGNGDWNGTAGSGGAVPTDLGDSIIQMFPTTGGSLAIADYYTPNAAYSYLLNGSGQTNICFVNSSGGSCPSSQTNGIPTHQVLATNDYDLGSGGLTLITPNPPSYNPCGSSSELIAAGKEGVVYGVCYSPGASSRVSAMGGLDACGYNPSANCFGLINSAAQNTACTQLSQGTTGAIAQCFAGPINASTAGSTSGGSHASMAFWAGSGTNYENYLYMVGAGDHMKAFQMGSNGRFNVNYPAAETTPNFYGWPGATPVVSWDGSTAQNAIVWAVNASAYGSWNPHTQATQAAGAAVLYAYTAVPAGSNCSTSACTLTELFSSSSLTNNVPNGPGAVKFTVPTVAGGMVFVAGGMGPTTNGTKTGYAPGPTNNLGGVNCAPTYSGTTSNGTCAGYLFVYGKL